MALTLTKRSRHKTTDTFRRQSLNRARALVVALMTLACVAAAGPAIAGANTRDNANSYMNTTRNLNSTPGNAWYYSVDKGTSVWMDCWSRGPLSMGQYKWFRITVRSGPRYGLVGWVPAPSVSNQWWSAPYCSY